MSKTPNSICRSCAEADGKTGSGGRAIEVLLICLAALAIPATFLTAAGPASVRALNLSQGGCPRQSAFSQGLPKDFRWPDANDALSLCILKEYGAIFVARDGVVTPPVLIFPDATAVAQWQSSLSTESAEIAGIRVRLQVPAMRALRKARDEASQAHVAISPHGPDAAQRTYGETLELWRRRVNPGLRRWVAKGSLSAAEAARIRKLPPSQQVAEILALEERGLYFSNSPSKSILSSVAPPGASQHLSMLAFDVKEHTNPSVRSILKHNGWYQTVTSDLPHFTYLGVEEHLLPSLGLKMVKSGGREFWVPDFECLPSSR